MRRNWSGLRRVRLVGACSLFVAMASPLLWLGAACPQSRSQEVQSCLLAGLVVTVLDSESGASVPGATVTATSADSEYVLDNGAYSGFLRVDTMYEGAYEIGEYVLHVEAPGYQSVTTDTLEVPEDSNNAGCPATTYWIVDLQAEGE